MACSPLTVWGEAEKYGSTEDVRTRQRSGPSGCPCRPEWERYSLLSKDVWSSLKESEADFELRRGREMYGSEIWNS
eukprot:IDg21421t1